MKTGRALQRLSPFLFYAAKALLLLGSRFLYSFNRCGSSRFCRSSVPVVQVMSYAVAVAAFRELTHNPCSVRYTVAILTLRHHLVFFLVTGYAEKRFVLGFAGNEQAECFTVTGSALLGRCVGCIGDSFRHMGFVTFLAVSGYLLSRVWLVALGALGNFPMDVVAEGTGEFGVFARICLELGNLRGVAGKARIGNIATEDYLFGLVRVFVTIGTVADFVVGLVFVALTAKRDDLPVCRRVTIVAILTGYLSLVGTAFGCDVSRSLYMAFGAVGTGESNSRFCRCRCRRYLRSSRLGCGFGCYCYRSEQKQG